MRSVVSPMAAAGNQASECVHPSSSSTPYGCEDLWSPSRTSCRCCTKTASYATTSLSLRSATRQLRHPNNSQFVGPQPRLLSWASRPSHTAAEVQCGGEQQGVNMQVQCISPALQGSGHVASSLFCRAWPNTSLKLSANGVARWPSSAGPAAHFALAVQRATPSSPA